MTSLADHYSRFRVSERVLLTGHSHQAWPDIGFAAQQQAWLDAAEFVDDKWSRAEVKAAEVRAGFARLLGTSAAEIALGQNTHELVTRWISALPLRDRPRLITTTGEFHSLRRQIDRLAEELDVVKIAAAPTDTLAERLAAAIDDRTAAVFTSSVLFETAQIVGGLGELASACERRDVRLLVDAYHHLNVVPFDITAMGLQHAFVTGGGYKYCQLGEGNAFLRVPSGDNLRPVLTGWFAEFADRQVTTSREVSYQAGAAAFKGATYDPTSHYRAAAVFQFHMQQGLTVERLHAINKTQVMLLKRTFEGLDIDPAAAHLVDMPDDMRGGFLAIRTTTAGDLSDELRHRDVWCDARGDVLRLGPAPYVSHAQIIQGMSTLGALLKRA
jgi:kynureninase